MRDLGMKIALCVLLAITTAAGAGSGDELTAVNVATLHQLIQPKPGELIWRDSIAWRTDLWRARQEAAAAGKPIYLWEMDGHPLGCT